MKKIFTMVDLISIVAVILATNCGLLLGLSTFVALCACEGYWRAVGGVN